MNQFTNFDSQDTQKIEFTNDVAPNPPIETSIETRLGTPIGTPITFQEQKTNDEAMIKIKEVLNPNEKILWTGRPLFRGYFFSNGLIFLAPLILAGPGFILLNIALFDPNFTTNLFFYVPMLFLVVFIVQNILHILRYKNIYYAVSNERIYIHHGIFPKLKIINISDLTGSFLSYSIESMLFGGNSGTITLATNSPKNLSLYETNLLYIPNVKEVHKLFRSEEAKIFDQIFDLKTMKLAKNINWNEILSQAIIKKAKDQLKKQEEKKMLEGDGQSNF